MKHFVKVYLENGKVIIFRNITKIIFKNDLLMINNSYGIHNSVINKIVIVKER